MRPLFTMKTASCSKAAGWWVRRTSHAGPRLYGRLGQGQVVHRIPAQHRGSTHATYSCCSMPCPLMVSADRVR